MRVLVTGAAGFIGFHTARALLERGDEIVGLDNLDDYYDVGLKRARLRILGQAPGFRFEHLDLADRDRMGELFGAENFRRVVHLAAQPGVRYGIDEPFAYTDSNVTGTLSVLEGCRHTGVEHLVFASSSSVYGANARLPSSARHRADHPLSLYAATKKSNEMMAHSYASLYGLAATGLRFFTVYGPFGRPDMALFLFTANMLKGRPIDVYNHGRHRRDFTYVDDAVRALLTVLDRAPRPDPEWDREKADPSTSPAPFRLYNVGAGEAVHLTRVIRVLERCLGVQARMNPLPLQPGDIRDTCSDVAELAAEFGYRPSISIEEGVKRFVAWYLDFYGADHERTPQTEQPPG